MPGGSCTTHRLSSTKINLGVQDFLIMIATSLKFLGRHDDLTLFSSAHDLENEVISSRK